MAQKSIKKNFVYNLVYQIVALLAPFIVTPYVSRVLGVDGIGEYSYANSIVSYFLLFAVLGTSTYGQRAIGYAQKDIEERSRAFWEIFIFRIFTGLVTLSLYAIYVFLIVPQASFTIYIILALNIINVIIDVSWFLQGMEEFSKTALTSIISRVMSIACVFLFVKEENDLWIYVLISTGFIVLGHLSMWLFIPRNLCKVKEIKPFRNIKSIFQLFLPTIATQIYLVLDKSMIGWFSNGFAENGYYEQADKIVKMALTAVTALGIVMIPRISRLYKEGKEEQVVSYIYKSYRYVWMTAIPIMFGLIAISDIFVPLFFGPGYEKCTILIPILSVLTIFIGLSNVNGLQFFIPTGKQNVLTLTVIIGAVINVILNAALIPFFASTGAAIASVIAELCVTAAGFIYIKRKNLYSLKPIFTCSLNYWIAGIVMFGVVYLVNLFLPVTLWALIVLIFVGVAVYSTMLLIFRDKMLFEILSKLFGTIKTKLGRTTKNSKDDGLDIAELEESHSEEGAERLRLTANDDKGEDQNEI